MDYNVDLDSFILQTVHINEHCLETCLVNSGNLLLFN